MGAHLETDSRQFGRHLRKLPRLALLRKRPHRPAYKMAFPLSQPSREKAEKRKQNPPRWWGQGKWPFLYTGRAATCLTRQAETSHGNADQNDESQFVDRFWEEFSSGLSKNIIDIPQMQTDSRRFEPHGHENEGGQGGGQNTGTPTGLLRLPVQKVG